LKRLDGYRIPNSEPRFLNIPMSQFGRESAPGHRARFKSRTPQENILRSCRLLITRSADSWQTIPAEPDPSNPSAEPGIYDVRSGADGTALDGTKYSDWK